MGRGWPPFWLAGPVSARFGGGGRSSSGATWACFGVALCLFLMV